jgi:hypothetical protein
VQVTNLLGGEAMRFLVWSVAAVLLVGCTTVYHAKVTSWDTRSLQSSASLVENCLRELGFEPRQDIGDDARIQGVSLPGGWARRSTFVTVDFDDGQWALRFVPPPQGGNTAESTAHEFEGCVQRSEPSHAIRILKGRPEPDWR